MERRLRRGPPPFRLWAALAPAAAAPAGLATLYFGLLSGDPSARLLYGAAKAFLLLWPLAASRLLLEERGFPRWDGDFSARGPCLRALGEGLASGLALGVLLWVLSRTVLAGTLAAAAPVLRQKALEFGVAGHYGLFAVAASLFHATAEEYYWRWFLFGRLRRLWPPWAAHGGAAAAFAAHHVLVAAVLLPGGPGVLLGGATGLAGLFWSLLYARHRNLVGAWASHLSADLSLFAVGWRLLAP
ncbi:MAG: CPBP family glutamic-type intramembrane protease [Acidobacteriota bacterium]